MGDKLEKEGFEKTYEWAVQITKKYPNCNMLIWQIAVMLDAGRITGACGNPEQYDEQINAWYEMVLQDENEEIQYHAADSLFGFYLREKEYVAAEKYLNYFSEHDPMKKIFRARLYKEQGKTEEAYKTIEEVLLSQSQTLGVTFSFLLSMALKEKDFDYYYGQILVYKLYKELEPMAQAMSDLVKASQVDTKKFGKNSIEMRTFLQNVADCYTSPYFTSEMIN